MSVRVRINRRNAVNDSNHSRLNKRHRLASILESGWILNDHKFRSLGRSHHMTPKNFDGNEWLYDSDVGQIVLNIQSDDYLSLISNSVSSDLGLREWTIIARARLDSTLTKSLSSTGASGVSAYPLVTKGRGEADGDNRDANYFMGLDSTFHVACDFEDSDGGDNNNPLTGATALSEDVWYDIAYTFDGSTAKVWYRLLDGADDFTEDGSLATSGVPRYDSIQHFSIGSALNSSAVSSGNWGGQIAWVLIFNFFILHFGLNYLILIAFYIKTPGY